MELHIIAAWVAFGVSIVAPLAFAYYQTKKQRKLQKALLGVVQPKKKGK